jgi:hypothetical protein
MVFSRKDGWLVDRNLCHWRLPLINTNPLIIGIISGPSCFKKASTFVWPVPQVSEQTGKKAQRDALTVFGILLYAWLAQAKTVRVIPPCHHSDLYIAQASGPRPLTWPPKSHASRPLTALQRFHCCWVGACHSAPGPASVCQSSACL